MDKLKDILFDEETVEIPIIGDDDFEDVIDLEEAEEE